MTDSVESTFFVLENVFADSYFTNNWMRISSVSERDEIELRGLRMDTCMIADRFFTDPDAYFIEAATPGAFHVHFFSWKGSSLASGLISLRQSKDIYLG